MDVLPRFTRLVASMLVHLALALERHPLPSLLFALMISFENSIGSRGISPFQKQLWMVSKVAAGSGERSGKGRD